ncbi:hypothetical protein ZWY2020_020337 [Hordeum vulgare]|nr:hypothetical protein ZWY2020_020337 [Hordeum vulgare]
MASHHIIRSMLPTAMDQSSGAPSTSRQAKSAPILSGDRIVRSGAADELWNPHVFSANGSWGSSSQAWDNDDGGDEAISSYPLVPYVGMTFDIVDNARAYYNKYAFSHGF